MGQIINMTVGWEILKKIGLGVIGNENLLGHLFFLEKNKFLIRYFLRKHIP